MPYTPTPPPATAPFQEGGDFVPRDAPSPEKAVTAVTAVTRLLGMSFEEFSRARCIVEIAVPWLKKHLWLVPVASCVEALVREGVERGYIWTAAELTDLYGNDVLGANDRRGIALLRAHFGIEVVSVTASGDEKGCPTCHSGRFWRSTHGVVVCGVCHPPATPGHVAEWIDAGRP